MSVPAGVHFDRYAELTGGLVQVSGEIPLMLAPNGMASVTGWLTVVTGAWYACYDAVVTSWTACYSAPTTTWTATYAAPTTTWTPK